MSTDALLRIIEKTCTIDSRTAAGSEGTLLVGKIYEQHLVELGFEVTWHKTLPEEGKRGQHLTAVRNGAAKKKLILIGHTDTVLSPQDVPFRHDASQHKIFGSGVCDMKGGNAILIESIAEALKREQAVRDACVIVLFNCTEEVAGPSFRTLLRQAASGARACLCYEPARLGEKGDQQFVVSRKGVIRSNLKCHGRAAHAGNAHAAGINANRELGRKVEELESLTDYARELTVNVGVIQGGLASNQVSELATATFDLRAFDPAVLEEGLRAVRAICEKSTVSSSLDGATTRCELHEYRSYPPWPRSAAGDALAARYIQLAQQRGLNVSAIGCGGGSDASHVADLAPTIDGLGILGGHMHNTDEWADTQTLAARKSLAADLIIDCCRS